VFVKKRSETKSFRRKQRVFHKEINEFLIKKKVFEKENLEAISLICGYSTFFSCLSQGSFFVNWFKWVCSILVAICGCVTILLIVFEL